MRHRMPEAAAAEGWNMAMEDVKSPRLHTLRYSRLLSQEPLVFFPSYAPSHYILSKPRSSSEVVDVVCTAFNGMRISLVAL